MCWFRPNVGEGSPLLPFDPSSACSKACRSASITPASPPSGTTPWPWRAHRLTSYDAAYLELALRLGLPLASRDQALQAAARSEGVPLLPT